jgi:hypothetical protein
MPIATAFLRRRFRGQFGISASRMTVTTRPPWWARGAALTALVASIGGIAWWAFDFGQLFGRVNHPIDARITAAESENARLRNDASVLRIRNTELESDLAMSRGAEQAISRQVAELAAENARLKEEASLLKRLVVDAGQQSGGRKPR